ncbi:MAG: Ig-like domain-containing protein, partial [Isosphaeraceae bacterium]|nr:Ig-like domain-containing protein [Isosphaeraceae bacterium]
MSLPWFGTRRRASTLAWHDRTASLRSRRLRRRAALEPLEERQLLAGTWTDLTNAAPAASSGIGTMMLLTDGEVIAEGGGVNNAWFKLTPDAAGSYVDGTWSQIASTSLERLYFGSNVLQNGNVFILGGEYSGPQGAQNLTNTGEVYNPIKNTWTNIANFPDANFGDDPTVLLPNGNILAGDVFNTNTYIYNPSTDTWTQSASKLDGDQSDEETWVKLPDGSILTYDVFAPGKAQRYIPSQNQWVETGATPPLPLTSAAVGFELGPAFLLPDGRVFYLGATGHTAYYTPSTDSWTQGPDIPNGLGTDDAAGAELPDGNIIFTADQPLFDPNGLGTTVFEFNPTTNKYTVLSPPSGLDTTGPAFTSRMLVLPTGQVLVTTGGTQLAVYTPDTGAAPALQPTISSVVQNKNGTFTLTGTQLNGVSQGASYGDDAEMDTNYPIVSLVDASGDVYYARTTNWSNTGVSTGSTPETVIVTMPSGANPARPLAVTAESPAGATENQAFSNAEVATFTDPTGIHPVGNYTASIDWGDGTTTTGQVSGPDTFGIFTVDGDHLYTTATNNGSSWVIKVTVTEAYSLFDSGSGIISQPFSISSVGTGTVDANVIDIPPVVTGIQTLTGVEGLTTGSLRVATFIDPAGALPVSAYAATIDWGDGSTTSGSITYAAGTQTFSVFGTHTYTEEGTYLPIVTVDDTNGGASGQATDTATIADAPLSPIAATFSSTEGATFTGLVANFTDASPFGAVSDFTATIKWGDGTTSTGTVKKASLGTFGVTGTHQYNEEGTYNVSVVVKDDGGSTTTVASTAQIADAPLTPNTASIAAVEGQLIPATTTVATFIDAYTAAPLSDFSATINWGDGVTTVGTITSLGAGRFSVAGGTIYPESGVYAVTVAISDRGGSTTTALSSATITDAALTSSSVNFFGVEGQTIAPTTVATFNDADIFSQPSDFTATIDWGDGTTTAGSVVSLSGGNYAISGSHMYMQAQPYSVAVTINDIGGQTTSVVSTATVADAPLIGAAPYTLTPTVGQAFSGAVAQFTDPDRFAAPSNFIASINWGDGTMTQGVITPSSVSPVTGAVTFTVSSASSHAYQQVTPPGGSGFGIRVQIVDLGGSTLTSSAVANVADAPITASGVSPIQKVEGSTFSGVVAQFVDGNSFALASNFTATINWGDGNSSPGIIALNATDPLNPFFTVTGTNTFAEEGQYFINVTVTDNVGQSAPVAITQANIADAPLTAGSAVSISPVVGTSFSGAVATFSDTYTSAPLSDFTATINWGDGTSVIAGSGTVSQPGGVGTPFIVSGTHTYANAASAIPIAITIHDAGGSSLSLGASAHVQVALTGGVNPSSITSGTGSGVTRNTQPQFSGRVEPGATVELLANGVNDGATTADGLGNWSITSKTLTDGTYTFIAEVLAANS